MIREEMRSEAKVRLIGYRKNHEMVANWESYSDPQSKRGDNMGIRSGKTSDPTANAATNRADPPQYIVVACFIAWMYGVDLTAVQLATAVGLSIVVSIFRTRRTASVDDASLLKR